MAEADTQNDAVELATELTIAWLSNPNTRAQADEVPGVLRTMHQAVVSLTATTDVAQEQAEEHKPEPAVTVRKSLASRDHLISLIDGKPYKTLRRHLATRGLTPDQYRERYGLKPDYPMVAPAYAEKRRDLAKSNGLGRKPRQAKGGTEAAPAPKRKGAAKTTQAGAE